MQPAIVPLGDSALTVIFATLSGTVSSNGFQKRVDQNWS
jgi:hypothetical protein